MSIDLDTLEDELRAHLGNVSTDELTQDEAYLLLNRSFWEILNKIPLRETEESATFTTVEGEGYYSTPSLFEAIRGLSIKSEDSDQWFPLNRITMRTHEEELNTDSDARGMPDSYYRERGGYRLQPIPDDTYSMRVKYWVTLSEFSDSTTASTLPSVVDEIILMGAVYRGWFRLRDYAAARESRNHHIGLMNSYVPAEAKEEIDSARAGVELPEELTTI